MLSDGCPMKGKWNPNPLLIPHEVSLAYLSPSSQTHSQVSLKHMDSFHLSPLDKLLSLSLCLTLFLSFSQWLLLLGLSSNVSLQKDLPHNALNHHSSLYSILFFLVSIATWNPLIYLLVYYRSPPPERNFLERTDHDCLAHCWLSCARHIENVQ